MAVSLDVRGSGEEPGMDKGVCTLKSLPNHLAGLLPALSWPTHLHIVGREDAQPAMMLPLQPVLVHLLVDVDYVTFLQSQLPVSDTSKLACSQASSCSDWGQVTQSCSQGAVCGPPSTPAPPPSARTAPGGKRGLADLLGGLCLEVKLEPGSPLLGREEERGGSP